jgi:hypothetical protein
MFKIIFVKEEEKNQLSARFNIGEKVAFIPVPNSIPFLKINNCVIDGIEFKGGNINYIIAIPDYEVDILNQNEYIDDVYCIIDKILHRKIKVPSELVDKNYS